MKRINSGFKNNFLTSPAAGAPKRPRALTPRRSDLVSISDDLKSFFSNPKLAAGSDHLTACRLWITWPRLAPSDVLKKTFPVSLQNGRLVLWAENSSHLQEAHFHTEELKTAINRFFKKEIVQDIYFTLNKNILNQRKQAVSICKKLLK